MIAWLWYFAVGISVTHLLLEQRVKARVESSSIQQHELRVGRRCSSKTKLPCYYLIKKKKEEWTWAAKLTNIKFRVFNHRFWYHWESGLISYLAYMWNERYLHNWWFCFVVVDFVGVLQCFKELSFRSLVVCLSQEKWLQRVRLLISPKRPKMKSTLLSCTISLFSTNSFLPISPLDTESSTTESLSFLISQQAFSGYNKRRTDLQMLFHLPAFK